MSLVVYSISNKSREITSPEMLLELNKNSTVTNGILKIGMGLAKRYVEGKWELPMIGKYGSYLSILLWCYYACVSRRLCPPLEKLDEEMKKELWLITRTEIDPETREKQRLINLTKAQYALTELAKLIYREEIN